MCDLSSVAFKDVEILDYIIKLRHSHTHTSTHTCQSKKDREMKSENLNIRTKWGIYVHWGGQKDALFNI